MPKKKVHVKITDIISEKEFKELVEGLKKIQNFEFLITYGLLLK